MSQAIAKKEGVDLQRLRRQAAFDCLLARLFQAEDPYQLPWVLKGGYAMELRMKAARNTKDFDLTMRGALGATPTKNVKTVVYETGRWSKPPLRLGLSAKGIFARFSVMAGHNWEFAVIR